MTTTGRISRIAASFLFISALAATGCQVDVGGQNLPSPYYLSDDVQYFSPGNEFPLSREAATQKLNKAQAEELDQP